MSPRCTSMPILDEMLRNYEVKILARIRWLKMI